jgi:DNA-binding transcriptional MocR family regulator
VLLIQLDASSRVPAYLQIRDRIVALIEEETLRPGDRLPPTRKLARTVGVHRSTVLRAYDEIRALGYLESRAGSYTTVRRRARPPGKKPGRAGPSLVDWRARFPKTARSVQGQGPVSAAPAAPDDLIDFERLAADPALAPADDLRRCIKHVLVRTGPRALDYADPAGWPPLRETVAVRLRAHGVAVTADEILITAGAQHALDLALRMLTRPGDRVALEAPTYAMAHTLLRLHGLEAIEVPMREDGVDLDALETGLDQVRVKLVYTMPNFHNPTGVTTGQAHRERLLALCERHRVPMIEDGFEEEMKYFGQAVLPIKSMDRRGVVLYVGTFSKVVFPGLRVGWIAAPREAIALLTSIHHASCLSANTLAQAAAEHFCRGGELEAYLRRVHRVYRRRMQAMLQGLARHLPPEVTWTRPAGGYTLWLTLPGASRDEARWYDRLLRAGIKTAPGRRFFGRPPARAHLRLSIACVDEGRISEGCRRMGEVLGRGPGR